MSEEDGTKPEKIESFDRLLEVVRGRDKTKYLHFKVCRKKRSYDHHFLLLEEIEKENGENINDQSSQIEILVAHYTSSCEIITNNSSLGIGKFKAISIEITKGEQNDLFDFSSGLFLVNHPTLKAEHTIRKRLYEQFGERIFDLRVNNCEHAVNYILTGESKSNQANSNPCCAELLTAALGDMKEVGLKVAMMMALVSALAGSLTRYSYVSLMIASVAAQDSNVGRNETCSYLLGDNIIREVKDALDWHNEIPHFSEITSSEEIINDIKASLDNPLMCKISHKLAWKAIKDTFFLSLAMSVSVETVFVIIRILFVYRPLCKKKSTEDLIRMIFVRSTAGYLSIIFCIVCGSIGQAFLSPPALFFILFTFLASLFARYSFTLLASLLFSWLYCCHKVCCFNICSNESRRTQSCRNSRCNCIYYCIAILVLLLCAAGVVVPLYVYLD